MTIFVASMTQRLRYQLTLGRICYSCGADGKLVWNVVDVGKAIAHHSENLTLTGERPVNNRYSPLVENCTPVESDNFAVMRMVLELLGMDWDVPAQSDIEELRNAVAIETETDLCFMSRDRFADALKAAFQPKQTLKTINV